MIAMIDRLSPTRRTLLVAALLLFGLSSLGLSAARVHLNGVPVVLATEPVDPRSMFQGDYVVLNYEISRLDQKLFEGQSSSRQYPDIYVELQPGDPVWTPVRAAYAPIQPAQGHVVLHGKGMGMGDLGDVSVRVSYGIETFLVPEGQGRAIEQLRNATDRVTVRVMVAPDGAALPQNILVDGQPVFLDGGL